MDKIKNRWLIAASAVHYKNNPNTKHLI